MKGHSRGIEGVFEFILTVFVNCFQIFVFLRSDSYLKWYQKFDYFYKFSFIIWNLNLSTIKLQLPSKLHKFIFILFDTTSKVFLILKCSLTQPRNIIFYFMIDFWNIYDAIQLPDKNFIKHIVNTRVSSLLTIIKHAQKLFEIIFTHLSAEFMSHQRISLSIDNSNEAMVIKKISVSYKRERKGDNWARERESKIVSNSHASM